MAGPRNAAPVIIKRRKNVVAGGHHGGAWKVAYADFVTAMMAFFMLMWLLNATTEKQRKGLADYFNPSVPVNPVSGGGEGALAGDSVFAEETLARMGTGASDRRPTEADAARGVQDSAQDAARAAEMRQLQQVEQALLAQAGESETMRRLLRHVVTRVTDEGLTIEIFDLPEAPLFQGDTAQPEPVLIQIATLLAEVLAVATNPVAVSGHVRTYPIVLIDNPVWDLSAERAQGLRRLIETAGLPPARFRRVTGHADRMPVTADARAPRNNRVEVILLRTDR
ncbi:MAG: chemotaxis protein MotB [Rhodobacterales bacterium]|nr:chemotaxis protein MotB [Rhodobacterales bacterium]